MEGGVGYFTFGDSELSATPLIGGLHMSNGPQRCHYKPDLSETAFTESRGNIDRLIGRRKDERGTYGTSVKERQVRA